MSTFREVADRARIGGRFGQPLIADLAEALDTFEYNTARLFAVFNVSTISSTPLEQLQRQIHERTAFALEELRRETS